MKKIILLLIFVPFFLIAQNPFMGDKDPVNPVYDSSIVPEFIIDWSNSLQTAISDFAKSMEKEENIGYGILAFFSAVLFGMVHIIGPGHGKIFSLSYLGSQNATIKEGILLSALINIIDSISAGLLVLVGYGILSLVFSSFQSQAIMYLQIISYSLIIIFGIIHLLSHIKSHGQDHNHKTQKAVPKLKPLFLALAVGLVPCPVSIILLIFGIAHNMIPFSILMVAGVSFGGFIAMSMFTSLLIAGKTGIMSKLNSRTAHVFLQVLEYILSGVIILSGLIFLISTLFD